MPLGDEKHTLIYRELVNILGTDYVSDDPAVMEAFGRSSWQPKHQMRPEFIVLPGSTEDVQQIIRLANRYLFPFSVTSTGLMMITCSALKPYWCFIDPKRMNRLEIDEKNMHAIVEPYVTVAQVQADAMKGGLFYPVPGASSQASALANSIYHAGHWTSYRTGIGNLVLGIEWVLPTGEVLKIGSLATPGAGYCWGEGPGPDLRGILRGHYGHLGALGVVTRVAVKLFPWPGPSIWPTEGVQPEKKSTLPPEKFKSFFLTYPTLEKSIEAMRQIGKAEIGAVVMKFTPFDFVCWASKSNEEFWERWNDDFWSRQVSNGGHMVWVSLWAFVSERQLQYEEKVLKEIIQETGGELVPDEIHEWLDSCCTPNSVRDTHRLRYMRLGGRVAVPGMVLDTMHDVPRSIVEALEIKDKYSPPFGDTGRSIKFWPGNFTRLAFTEMDILSEKSDESERTMASMLQDQIKIAVENSSPFAFVFRQVNKVGPAFSNIHLILGKIKNGLDPNNLANPTRLIDMEEMEKMKM